MKQTDREVPGTVWHRRVLLWMICIGIGLHASLQLNPTEVSAAVSEKNLSAVQRTAEQGTYSCTEENKSAENTEQQMEERMAGGLEFSEIEQFLKEKDQTGIRFQDLMWSFVKGENLQVSGQLKDQLLQWLLQGLAANRDLFVEIIVVALAFSVLKNFAGSFSDAWISEMCFLMCYSFLMMLLLRSFLQLHTILTDGVGGMLDFMKLFIPTYCTAISFTMNVHSSAAVYSLIFLVIYLVEWICFHVLIPCVEIYVVIEFANHLTGEEPFRKMADLLADGVKVLLKLMISVILGINLIQGMVTPAIDRLNGNAVAKTLQMVPGIGNVVSGSGQIFLAAGILIKNGIGAAALVVLLLLCAVPFFRMAGIVILYKILAAVLEPVSDRRISGGMNGVACGGVLCLKIMSTSLILFFLTIALSTVATSIGTL